MNNTLKTKESAITAARAAYMGARVDGTLAAAVDNIADTDKPAELALVDAGIVSAAVGALAAELASKAARAATKADGSDAWSIARTLAARAYGAHLHAADAAAVFALACQTASKTYAAAREDVLKADGVSSVEIKAARKWGAFGSAVSTLKAALALGVFDEGLSKGDQSKAVSAAKESAQRAASLLAHSLGFIPADAVRGGAPIPADVETSMRAALARAQQEAEDARRENAELKNQLAAARGAGSVNAGKTVKEAAQ